MKVIRVFMIGLIAFNAMLVFTNMLGVFDYGGATYQGKNVTNISGADLTQVSTGSLFNFINPLAVGACIGILIVAGLLAWKLHSPAPIASGASLSIYTGIWIQTYGTLNQFPIPVYLLGFCTVIIAILMILDIIDIMGARNFG